MPAPKCDPPAQAPEPRPRNHFFALLPPAPVAEALAQQARALPDLMGGRAEPAHRIHLTLLFLGPLPAGHEAALRAAGEIACTATGPFAVEVDHLGRFERSDAVWVGPSVPPAPGLRALHAALRRACAGVPTARPPGRFSPHVTVLRGARRDAPIDTDPIGPWRWTAQRFALLRTDPSARGRVYTRLGEWPLRAVEA